MKQTCMLQSNRHATSWSDFAAFGRSPHLTREFAPVSTARGGVESLHLLHLLLPHPAQSTRGDVKVRQLLSQHREQLALLYFHCRKEQRSNESVFKESPQRV